MMKKILFILCLSVISESICFPQNFSMGGMTVQSGNTSLARPTNSPVDDNSYYRKIVSDVERNKPDRLAETLASLKTNPELLNEQLNQYFVSPLFFAIHAKKSASVATLLKYGANPSFALTEKTYKKFISYIGRNPIDSKQTLEGTCTPLAFACMYVNTSGSDKKIFRDIIKLLLDAGADCNGVGFEGKIPAYILAEREMQDELKILLDTGKVNFNDERLQEYMKNGGKNKITEMLKEAQAKSKPAALTSNGKEEKKTGDSSENEREKTTGHAVKQKPAFSGRPTITFDQAIVNYNEAELLKHLGVVASIDDPIQGNKWKHTPLLRAVVLQNVKSVKFFLKYGASWKPEDIYFCNALTYAKIKNNEEIENILMEEGAKLPDCDSLDQAVKQERLDKIEEFIKKERKGTSFIRPVLERNIRTAVSLQRLKSYQKLIDLGGNINQLFLTGNLPAIFYFIEAGRADFLLASQGKSYQLDMKMLHPVKKITPLAYAVSNSIPNQIDVVKAILKLGADINGTDKKKKTPLMYAAESGNTGMVKLLILEGANTGLKDVDGRTYSNYLPKSTKKTLEDSQMENPDAGIE